MKKRKAAKLLSLIMTLVLLMGMSNVKITAYAQEDAVKQQGKITNTENVMNAEGTTSFGEKIADEINEQSEEQANSDYYISKVSIKDNTATVNYFAVKQCMVIIAVYNDDGTQMLASANATLHPMESEISVALENITSEQMPETFLIKAFIVDEETNKPLAKAYENNEYTKEFQDFLSKTAEDFSNQQVINLDENTETNFVVFREGTIHAKENETSNHLIKKENNTYVIENADSNVLNLKNGDIFYYETGEEDIILRIKECSVDGTTITITEDDSELEDLFSYIKIETDYNDCEFQEDTENLEEGLTYLGTAEDNNTTIRSIDTEAGFKKKWSNYKYEKEIKSEGKDETKNVKLNMELSLNIEGKLKVYYNGFTKLKIEATVSPSLKGTVEASGKLKKTFQVGKFGVSPIAGVYLTVTPGIDVEVSASIKYDFNIKFTVGCGWESGRNLYNMSSSPEVKSELKLEGKLYIGLNLNPEITVISEKIFNIGITSKIGAELSAEMSWDNNNDRQHTCSKCVDGDIRLKGEVSAELEFLKGVISLKTTLWDLDKKLGDFYYSFDKGHGGFGECPDVVYRVVITVTDKDGKPLQDVLLTNGATAFVDLGKTDKNGILETWLPNGTYTISVSHSNITNSKPKKIKVADKKATMKFQVDWKSEGDSTSDDEGSFDKTAHGAEIDSGNCGYNRCHENDDGSITREWEPGDNVKYILYEDGTLYIYGEGDMYESDMEGLPGVPWHENGQYLNIKKVYINSGVTSTGECMFADCHNLMNITIPNSVTSIGGGTFFDCNSLSEIEIPNSVTSIGWWAFDDCSSLSTIKIPNSVTSIAWWAFSDCSNLSTIEIPNSVTYIGSEAFVNTKWIEEQRKINPLVIINNIVIDGKKCTGNVKIPNGVTSIGDDAFSDCNSLNTIEIPNTVTSIGNSAFNGCSSLSSIEIPNTVTSIGDYTFNGCSSLSSIEIPNSVTSIGYSTFRGCSNLSSIEIPNTVTSIGDYTFNGCSSLSSIEIPNSVTSIGSSAFEDCSSLSSIKIPNSVTSIGDWAFVNCSNLSTIEIPNSVTYIGISAFSYTKWIEEQRKINLLVIVNNIVIDGEKCTGNVKIPNGVTSIGNWAFEGCSSLSSIEIPNSVTSIEYGAFKNCNNLSEIKIPNTMTSIGDFAFDGCRNLSSIEIPSSVTSIGYGSFDDCADNVVIYAPSGSAAEKYAKEHNITFQPLTKALSNTASATSNTMFLSETSDNRHIYNYTASSAGKECLFVVVKDNETEDLLSSSNLLYIDQKTSDDTLVLNFEYQTDGMTEYKELVFEEGESTSGTNTTTPGGKPTAKPGDDDDDKKITKGDINGNGYIDLDDVYLALNAAVGIIDLSGDAYSAANLYDNEMITLDDVIMILKAALGIINLEEVL